MLSIDFDIHAFKKDQLNILLFKCFKVLHQDQKAFNSICSPFFSVMEKFVLWPNSARKLVQKMAKKVSLCKFILRWSYHSIFEI